MKPDKVRIAAHNSAARKTTPPPLPPYQPKSAPSVSAQQSVQLPPELAVAATLLKIQSEVIEAATPAELAFVAANSPRTVLRAQQIVVLQRDKRDRFVVQSVSSVSHVDRTSPAVLWFQSLLGHLSRRPDFAQIAVLPATAFDGGHHRFGLSYPLGQVMWLPWVDRQNRVVAGMLLLRSTPWTEAETAVGRHLAPTFAHAWVSITKGSWAKSRAPKWSRKRKVLSAVAAAALLLVPVPLTALAPVEVAPKDAQAVTPGIEGVVEKVLVEPNTPVKRGQPLVQLADLTLKNRFAIAEREVAIAQTKYKRAAQSAFADARGRHELGVARSELALKIAERNYAFDLLSRTVIRADRDGVAFFGDKRDLVGRPVAVGERLMEIARPDSIEFRIDLGVSDAIVLKDRARVKAFLDSNPLAPIDANLSRTGYRAQIRENQQLAYRLVAEAPVSATEGLRLGLRGTAQVYGDLVPLGYYMLRRPIATARQWLGL